MVERKNPFIRFLHPFFTYSAYLFLYVPVFIIAVFSFNDSAISVRWHGFSLRWYAKLFYTQEIIDALNVSMVVAISSTILSVLIATALIFGSSRWKSWVSSVIFYPNIILPDIALAIGVLSLFTYLKVPLGYGSLIIGHTIVGLGFSIPIIRARFIELDPVLTEASLDLGATTLQTFRKVIIPLMRPSLIAAGLVSFTLSLDDFLIAFFCSSPKVQTLSIYVYSQLKETVDPSINAISVLLLALSSVVTLLLCSLKIVDQVIGNE